MGGPEKSDDLLGVNNSDEPTLVVDDGQRTEVVFVEELGDLAAVSVDIAGNDVTLREGGQRSFGLGEQELDQRDKASDPLLPVEQVDIGDDLNVAFKVAQCVDGLIDDGHSGKSDIVGGHAAGGGVTGELEEILDVLALLWIHLFEDGLRTLIRQFGEKVCSSSRVHLFDDAGDLLGVECLDKGLLHLGLDLLEGLGGDLFVEGDEESLALGRGKFLEDVGDVGGVHLREAILLDAEANPACRVTVDEVDEVPGDHAGAETGGDLIDWSLGKALEEATYCAAHANFNLGDAEGEGKTVFESVLLAVLPDEIDVVDANDLVTVNIDDLLVEEVALEKEKAVIVRQGNSLGGTTELDCSAGSELEMSNRNEVVTIAAFGEGELENDAVNVGAIDGGSDSQLADMADGSTLGVDDGRSQEGGDARPLIIGVLGHSPDALPDTLYLLLRMLAQRKMDVLVESRHGNASDQR
jgi:hypothetical protein